VIFLDTGALLARYLARDQHHAEAVAYFDELAMRRERLITSNFVVDETLTLLGRRAGHRFAAARGRAIYASQMLAIVHPGAEEEEAALELFEKLADQGVSFTDCVSFALMRAHRIQRAFTFDWHFAFAGFRVLPGPSTVHQAPAPPWPEPAPGGAEGQSGGGGP
jgi:predicted nucleic acid-binding protein